MLKQYLERTAAVVGERTPDEARFDREVIRWLAKGKSIGKAIMRANEKYPNEALRIDGMDTEALAAIEAHYAYLMEHERIMRQFDPLSP